jgi:hypothetical protein
MIKQLASPDARGLYTPKAAAAIKMVRVKTRRTNEDRSAAAAAEIKDPEQAWIRDLKKQRINLMKDFNVSRDEFVKWYLATTRKRKVQWTDPVVSWMFAAWVNGSGNKEWLTQMEKDQRERQRQIMLRKKEEQQVRMAKAAAEKEAKRIEYAKQRNKIPRRVLL